jgi:uncharacterized coiled-coil protein SlyX
MDIISYLAIAAFSGIISALIAIFQELEKRKKKEPTLQERISELTEQLKSSSAVITEIEQEISKRKNLVAQQEEAMRRYELLKDVDKSQVEAIAQILEIPVKKQSRRTFWLNIAMTVLIGLGIFALGYFLGGK